MFSGINPNKIQGMMKKMGISQTPVDAHRVIFELKDRRIIIDEPSVIKISIQGKETFQVSGEAREVPSESLNEEDIKMVSEKTGKSFEEAKNALKQSNGDIAQAILLLK